MAFCGKCGNELREGAKFCPKCGCPIVGTTVEKVVEADIQSEQGESHSSFLWNFVVYLIPTLIALIMVFYVTYNFVPSIHCKLFSWFPFFESPSVVAYNYYNCIKDGNTVGMMDYVYTSGCPSRAKMKKRMEEIKTKGSSSDKEGFETFSKLIMWGIEQEGGVKDLSVVKQNISDNSASVEVEVTRKSGMKDTETLSLTKDEDGKWAFHLKFD